MVAWHTLIMKKRKQSTLTEALGSEQLLKRCKDVAAAAKNAKPWSGLLPALSRTFGLSPNPQRITSKHYRTTSSIELGKQVEQELAATITKTEGSEQHRVTKWVLEYCKDNQWTLLDSQIELIDPVSNVRTWIDFLAYDEKKRKYVLIELKTGYDRGYRSPLVNERPKLVLIDKPDSYETRHVLQLTWMDWALENLVGIRRSQFYSCIVRATNNRNLRIKPPKLLPPWALKKRSYIVELVRERERKRLINNTT